MLIRNPRIEEAPLQKDLMLFDPESSKFYVLNPTMAFVWRHCDGARSMTQIAESLEGEFSDVDRGRAETDVKVAVEELEQLGLLSRRSEVPA
jgi:hypothetical protein